MALALEGTGVDDDGQRCPVSPYFARAAFAMRRRLFLASASFAFATYFRVPERASATSTPPTKKMPRTTTTMTITIVAPEPFCGGGAP
jgi:hypothetical protein